MNCVFCKEVALLGTDPPTCVKCAERLQTHFAVYCDGCNTLYWLRKSPENVMFYAEQTGADPQYLLENAIVIQIPQCKGCLDYLRRWGLVTEKEWMQ
jgi:hypothetical protein